MKQNNWEKEIELLSCAIRFPELSIESLTEVAEKAPASKLLLTANEFAEKGMPVKESELPHSFSAQRNRRTTLFMRGGVSVPLEQATPEEIKQIAAETIQTTTDVTAEQVELYDVSQTQNAAYTPLLCQETLYPCIQAMALVNGIEIVERNIPVEDIEGYYDEECQQIILSDSLPEERKGIAALEWYCQALVQSTTSHPPAMQQQESYLLSAALLKASDIPVESKPRENTGQKVFMPRLLKQCRYLRKQAQEHAPQPKPAAPSRRPQIVKDIAENFLKEL